MALRAPKGVCMPPPLLIEFFHDNHYSADKYAQEN
jgi:hypothetical protein